MTNATLEERLTKLEEKVAWLANEKIGTSDSQEGKSDIPWWEELFGAFKDNPDYDAAMRLGAAYRKAQPNPADNPEAVEL